jgi:hypothetical protein
MEEFEEADILRRKKLAAKLENALIESDATVATQGSKFCYSLFLPKKKKENRKSKLLMQVFRGI